jgi:hypothetical protein
MPSRCIVGDPKGQGVCSKLVAMDTCCGLDLIREDMVPMDAIRQYVFDAPRVRDAIGHFVNLSGAVSLEVSIADQVFKITLFVAPQVSVSLILGPAFMTEHVQSLLPLERLVVLSIDVSLHTGGRYSPYYLRCQVG